jgi:NTE family protein
MFKGKKIALVASGGGGRAIAHAGVIEACHRLGIKFDIVVGSSAGGIGAVLYALYQDPDKIVDNFRPFWKRKYKFPQFGWGRMITLNNFFSKRLKSGLFDLAKAEEFLKETLPTDDFTELEIPTYVSATSLEDHDGVFFGTDVNSDVPISKALMASCCIPVLFRPVEINGKYYVDGEIKRPLAIEMAIEKGADTIIVSDIYTPYVQGIGTSGMFNIFGQIVNMLLEDKSMRGVKICKANHPEKNIILISPPVGDISALNTYAYEKLQRAGYNAAMRVLEKSEV